MTKIFISYRRDDAGGHTGRIYDRLVKHFGKETVFMDVHTMPIGSDWEKRLDDEVSKCDILLAMIGDDWLGQKDGRCRLDDPNDFVRIEIQTALKRNIPVIPVLVGKAVMPEKKQLPTTLKKLSSRYAAQVRSVNFDMQVAALIQAIEEEMGRQPKPTKVRELVVSPPPPDETSSRIVKLLQAGHSVWLVAPKGSDWQSVLNAVSQTIEELKEIDLEDGRTANRRGLIEIILKKLDRGRGFKIPPKNDDLAYFATELERFENITLAFTHFALAADEERSKEYGNNFFAAINHLIKKERKLKALFISTLSLADLFSADHLMSALEVKTVHLPI